MDLEQDTTTPLLRYDWMQGHNMGDPGTYPFSLTVTDNDGLAGMATGTVYVPEPTTMVLLAPGVLLLLRRWR